ncbi:MFS transporter [Nocardiopsis sp. NPDC058631]|uniref:MFS transporter n=1 Tax=Nocardiopsis sp. NPDC058631 TaxID=3346566 RepID=UPI003663BC56
MSRSGGHGGAEGDLERQGPGGGAPALRPHLLTTALVLTVVVASFETTATATLMPAALDELGGRHVYALVFGVFTLAQLAALAVGGWLCPTYGPARTFVLSAVLHGGGLLVCATALTPWWLLAGRLFQGAGAGLALISVYVLVGACYAEERRGRVLGLVSMGWAAPGLLGPPMAGLVTDAASWRAVLAPVPFVEAAMLLAVWPALAAVHARGLGRGTAAPLRGRLAPIALLSTGVLTAMTAPGLAPAVALPLLAVSVALVVLGARPLFPPGALRLARGLPSAVLLRGLVGGPWMGLLFVVPLALAEGRGYSLSASGAVLSCGVVGFTVGGVVHSLAWAARVDRARMVLAGLVLQACGMGLVAAGLGPAASAAAYVGWGLTGLGASLAVTALNASVLALSGDAERGGATSAMAVGDSTATAVVAGLAGAAVAVSGTTGPAAVTAAQAVLLGTAAVLLLLVPAVHRLRPGAPARGDRGASPRTRG